MGKRLFVGVDLDGLADGVRSVQERFAGADGLRLTDPEQAHVTLKFLGDTDADRVDELVAALEGAVDESGVAPFEARIGGLGVFPSLDYISVVWVGVREGHGDAELTALHEAIEDRTVAMGFDPEDHEFTPHATVARLDHAGGKERVQRVVREADPDVGALRVEEVRLTESVLRADGPEYSTLAAVSLD
ncbi:RNA 2',3'-cyclic phosphodiesterase [Haloarcula litorea]|uniref:RNA 2',3'-cyclic phosphodiesterase n=1 Tax=Haloarcula litorea TaxID=3032579 RepID=UPI0023E8D567|nr:RNA 2',3'-cyclic phosphodiesterase [Halomicroarcula sp. GDY20]